MNPYEILGVGKKAAASTIKNAYRKLSKKHHPDIGGDEDLFKQINTAYQILKDPERRKKYDETGDTSEKQIKTVQQMAHDALAAMFENALKNGIAFDKSQPLMDIFRTGVEKDLQDARKAKVGLESGIAQLEVLRKRITRDDDEDNVFEKLTDMHIRNNKERLEKCVRAIEALDYLLEELKHYKSFDQIIRTVRVFRTYTGTGNTSTSWFGG